MKKAFFILCLIFSSPFCMSLLGQGFVKSEQNNFEWRLIGRVFFDGGVFVNDKADLGNAFQVNDLRLGTLVHFLDYWNVKLELGYGDNKISFKDVYINYERGDHSFYLGYYYEPFGYDRVGTSNYRFMESATAEKALGNKRKLGVSYAYNSDPFNIMGGVFSDGDVEVGKPLDGGYSLVAKLIGRPLLKDRQVLHIGIAPRFSNHGDKVSFTGGAPTPLLAKKDNSLVVADIDHMINQWKFEAEMIAIYHKWYLEGHYLMAHVNRVGVDNYNAQGGFAQLGYMLLGEKHNYNAVTGMVVNPAPKSLEILCRYNAVNLNDAEIRGGRLSDITVGANYFINKFIAAKLNYTHVMVGHGAPVGADDFDLIQARVQFSF